MHLCFEEKALAILHFSKSGEASLCQMFGEQNSDFQDLRNAAKHHTSQEVRGHSTKFSFLDDQQAQFICRRYDEARALQIFTLLSSCWPLDVVIAWLQLAVLLLNAFFSYQVPHVFLAALQRYSECIS